MADLGSRGVVFKVTDYGDMKTVDGILEMPNGTRGAWFKDSEGNTIGVFQDAGGSGQDTTNPIVP